MLAVAASFTDFVLAVHILAVVVAFGATFAYPLLFAAARRADPLVMPWLVSVMQRIDRFIVNPGLTVVLIAGIVLATEEHRWGDFFVAWGLGAVFVIGAIVGSFMIPREGRLARVAARDLSVAPAAGTGGAPQLSDEFHALLRQVSIGGAVLDLIVVVTIFMMATHA